VGKTVGAAFLLALLLVAFVTGCLADTTEGALRPRAVDGVLNLSDWDLQRDGPVSLDGDWEFYWEQLLEPRDFRNSNSPNDRSLISIPRSWNGYIVEGKELGGDGYATFRLQINLSQNQRLALRIPIMCTAYKLWVNGELLATNGQVGRSRQQMVPQYRPQVVALDLEPGDLELVVQVSNFMHRRGGMWESIKLGTETQIRRQHDLRLAMQLFLFGSFFALAVHYSGLFVVRRRELYAAYFALACLLMSARVLLVGEIYWIQLFPSFSWVWELKIEYLTYYLSMLVLLLLLQSLFPTEVSGTVRLVTLFLSLGYSALVLFTPAYIYTHTLTSYQLYTFFLVFYFVYVLVLASKRRQEGARFMLVGGILYCASIVYDVFFSNYRALPIGHLAPLGLFMFLLAQHLALMSRLTASFFRLEDLSERLLAMDKIKDEFLANTSHELRTPLSGIAKLAESMLGDVADPLTVQQQYNLSLIMTSSNRLCYLVDDILDFSRLEYKDLVLELGPVNLKQSVDMVVAVCTPLTQGKKLELNNRIPEDFPLAQADHNRVLQILYNLIGNAIKFTPSGSVTISAYQQEQDDMLVVAVADSGIGISLTKLGVFFNRFNRRTILLLLNTVVKVWDLV
jgi:two-component system sensor histidine kinase ChiS